MKVKANSLFIIKEKNKKRRVKQNETLDVSRELFNEIKNYVNVIDVKKSKETDK